MNSSTSNHWFVCPQIKVDATSRLFFFPYAGGGPAVFNKWIERLPEHIEGWSVHYPGRGSRYSEPPLTRMDQFVEGLMSSPPAFLDKPFSFFGHSLGGIIAFELAQALRRNHLPQPAVLFAAGCGAPHIPDPNPPLHALTDTEFLSAIAKLNGVPLEILQNPEAINIFLLTLRADIEAAEAYKFSGEPPLDCPIVALGGLHDPSVNHEQLEGWAGHSKSNFKLHNFPGDHFFINSHGDAVMKILLDELR